MYHYQTLNKLLKNELSVTETYQRILDKFWKDVELGESEYLVSIYEAHKAVVSSLQALISKLGEIPAEDSGGLGMWAEIVLGGAGMLGKKTVLKALQTGEKSGAENYEQALQDPELSSEIRSLIEWKLLYGQQAHIRKLDRLYHAAMA
jgi:hypothetical protein